MPGISLHDLQHRFWRSIAACSGASAFDSELLAAVEEGPHLSSGDRIGVYADAYFLRLRDVLAEDFPAVARVLGRERFDGLACDYVRAFPSEHPSVRHLGRSFAEFIGDRADLPPYLGALARLEWSMIDAFDAPDSSHLQIEDLHDVAPERWPALRFVPTPGLAVVRAGWPVHRLWPADAPIAISPAPTAIRIWRAPDCQVLHASMDSREGEALKRMIEGASFAEICDAYGDLPQDYAANEAVATLARWLADGIIANLA